MYQIVADYLKTKKVKKAVILFLEWLMTKDTLNYQIHKRDLIERLWLIETFENMRHKNRVESTLTQCFETAIGLGFLKSDVIEDDSGHFHLELNQERCTRINANKKNKPKK